MAEQRRGMDTNTEGPRRHRRATRRMAGAGVALLAVSGASLSLGAGTSYASSHREAPIIAGDPRADNTDLYAFVSPDKPDTVTIIANWIPFEEPNGGPNYYPFAENAHYQVRIDSNGDGIADVKYTWMFTNHYRNTADQFLYTTGVVNNLTDKTLNFYQTYDVVKTVGTHDTVVLHNAMAAPSFTGKASMPHYDTLRSQAVRSFAGG